jgi:hypothetical protein
MKSNDQLASLVALEKSAQATTALAYVGATVVVDGATAQLAGGSASWNLNVSKPSTATITIKDSIGQNVYTGTVAVSPGTQTFTWNGRGNDGDSGPTAATPSPPPRWTPTSSRSPFQPRCRRSWIRSISRRIRRSCRSTARTTHSTRSSASFDRRSDRPRTAVALRAERVKVFERAISVKLRSSPRMRGPRALKTGCPLSRARTDMVQAASIRNGRARNRPRSRRQRHFVTSR